MVMTLPSAPAALPADTYAARHRAWWEQCDVLLRQEDQRQRDESEANRLLAIAASNAHGAAQSATAVAMNASVEAQHALAAAIALPQPTGSGFSEAFVMGLLRIVLGKQEPPSV